MSTAVFMRVSTEDQSRTRHHAEKINEVWVYIIDSFSRNILGDLSWPESLKNIPDPTTKELFFNARMASSPYSLAYATSAVLI